MSDEVKEVKETWWTKLWKFIGAVFSTDTGVPSMNRVLSFIFGIASVVFAGIMFVHSANNKVLDKNEMWLVIVFMVVAMLGKNIQKIVEMIVEKKKM